MMSEGTIISYKNIAGKIQGDDGKIYDFNRKAIVEGNDAQAIPGRRVRFQADGERATRGGTAGRGCGDSQTSTQIHSASTPYDLIGRRGDTRVSVRLTTPADTDSKTGPGPHDIPFSQPVQLCALVTAATDI